MALLAFDTSTVIATAAVGDAATTLAEATREVTTHSEGLIGLIDDVLRVAGLEVSQLDAIACGRGPGSYTGLRIGLATAKGLCVAAGKPLVTFSSLLLPALAVDAAALAAGREILVLLDARRGEVFGCRFVGGVSAGDEFVCRPADIAAWVDPGARLLLVGDGAQRYASLWSQLLPQGQLAAAADHTPRACFALGEAARCLRAGEQAEIASAAPVYLRAPDIRVPKRREAPVDLPAAQPEQADGDPALPSPELLEAWRRSGLRLDREGRWWHEGELVRHAGLGRALHRWIDRLEDGRYVVRLDADRYAYIDVEDTPFIVRQLTVVGEGPQRRLHLRLSDGSTEELAYATLRRGEGGALYCQVKGRFLARLSRAVHFALGELLLQDGEHFVLEAAGTRVLVG